MRAKMNKHDAAPLGKAALKDETDHQEVPEAFEDDFYFDDYGCDFPFDDCNESQPVCPCCGTDHCYSGLDELDF